MPNVLKISKDRKVCRKNSRIQSTTRITDFFVVCKMSGVLVRFVILVGAPIQTRRLWYVAHIGKGFFDYTTNQIQWSSLISSIIEYWKKAPFSFYSHWSYHLHCHYSESLLCGKDLWPLTGVQKTGPEIPWIWKLRLFIKVSFYFFLTLSLDQNFSLFERSFSFFNLRSKIV